MPSLHIMTIGYEGAGLSDFIATLKAHRVRFSKDFRRQLAAKRPVLDSLAGTLSRRVALLGYERNPLECHRSRVAAALARRARAAVEHLMVPAIQ